MQIEPMGDSAIIIRGDSDWDPAPIAAALRASRLDGVEDCVSAYHSLAVYFEPDLVAADLVADWIRKASASLPQEPSKLHIIPVCYSFGEDLEEVAKKLRLSVDDVIRHHTAQEFRCVAIGFSPGFPYLGYLPEPLEGLARRDTPRTRVPARSVAIAGKQTGVYPTATPGGWWLLGLTPYDLVDVSDGYFPIQAGDRVQFRSISEETYHELVGRRL